MGRSLWARSQQGLQRRPCLKKIRTKPNKAKDKTKTEKCEMRPRAFLRRKPVLEDHSMLPNMLAPQAGKRKTGCNVNCFTVTESVTRTRAISSAPRNSRIINWKIFIKHLGGTCHKLGIPGRRLSGSPEQVKAARRDGLWGNGQLQEKARLWVSGDWARQPSHWRRVYETCKRLATRWTRPPKCSGNKEQHWELLLNTTSELPL